jgi:hypothetical protein
MQEKLSLSLCYAYFFYRQKGRGPMSQQHAQFEEEFRDGPQPHIAYQETSIEPPSVSYTTPALPPMQLHVNIPAQKLQAPVSNSMRQAGSGTGSRVVLAIFSMLFILILFIIAIVSNTSYYPPPNAWLALVLALIFAGVALWINVIVNRRH